MTTMSEPERQVTPGDGRGSTGNWTTPAVAALLALVVGFGLGWLVFGNDSPDVPSDVESLVDAYNQAWSDGDGETAVSLMTTGARFVSDRYVAEGGISGDELVTHIEVSPTSSLEFGKIESVTGDLPYVVVTPGKLGTNEGIAVSYIVEEQGELKIAAASWFD